MLAGSRSANSKLAPVRSSQRSLPALLSTHTTLHTRCPLKGVRCAICSKLEHFNNFSVSNMIIFDQRHFVRRYKWEATALQNLFLCNLKRIRQNLFRDFLKFWSPRVDLFLKNLDIAWNSGNFALFSKLFWQDFSRKYVGSNPLKRYLKIMLSKSNIFYIFYYTIIG